MSWATGLLCLHKTAGTEAVLLLVLATGVILPIMLRLLNGTVCMLGRNVWDNLLWDF